MLHDPAQWQYEANGRWLALPSWGDLYLKVGALVASRVDGASRVVAAMAVPTRAFAAAFCLAGVVGERSQSLVPDVAAHLAYLRTLDLGTTVSYRTGVVGSTRGKGTLEGFEQREGKDYIGIRRSSQGYHLMPFSMADRIEPDFQARTGGTRTARFTSVNINPGLASGLFTPQTLSAFLSSSRLEGLIVGNRRLLRSEIEATSIAASKGAYSPVIGSLKDLVRPRSILAVGECYRSEIVSVAAKVVPARLATAPTVAIFDGARSFARWRSSYPTANWIVILERTDPRLMDAAELIDSLYASRIGDSLEIDTTVTAMDVECAVFVTRASTT